MANESNRDKVIESLVFFMSLFIIFNIVLLFKLKDLSVMIQVLMNAEQSI